jgi:hypothetical protein
MDEAGLARTMRRQCGVVARRQIIASGGDDLLIARMLRRREWAPVFEGVCVDHAGPLTRRQKAWAAVLVHDGAVLAGRDALASSSTGAWATTRPSTGGPTSIATSPQRCTARSR